MGAIAGDEPVAIHLESVAEWLSFPIFVTHAPGDANRLFIAEKFGDIEVLDLTTGEIHVPPFLDIPVFGSGETGLLATETTAEAVEVHNRKTTDTSSQS